MKNQNELKPFEIGDNNLEDVISARLDWQLDELINLVVAALHKEIIVKDNTQSEFYQALPDNIKSICAITNGQIIYKEQAANIYRFFTNTNQKEALNWVKQWNKKVPTARAIVNELFIDNISLAEVIQNLSAYSNSHFFIEKPINQAQTIYNYLKSKQVLTRGGLDVRTLKVGSLTYEYKNLVKSWFTEFEQHKIYKRCTVCVVTKAPEQRNDGCWEWEAERISDNQPMTFTVCEGGQQVAPYLFDHKRWDAENFV